MQYVAGKKCVSAPQLCHKQFRYPFSISLNQTYIWAWVWRWRWRRCWGWCWRRSRWTSPHGQPWTLSRSGGWTWSGPDNVASSASNGLSDLRGPEAVSAWIISLPRYHFHLTECLKENRLGQATLSGLCLTCPSSVTRSSLYLEARLWLLRSQVTRGLGLPVTEKNTFFVTLCLGYGQALLWCLAQAL